MCNVEDKAGKAGKAGSDRPTQAPHSLLERGPRPLCLGQPAWQGLSFEKSFSSIQ